MIGRAGSKTGDCGREDARGRGRPEVFHTVRNRGISRRVPADAVGRGSGRTEACDVAVSGCCCLCDV
ncbi:hypothetical protein SDC9_129460 [bioreactor metagenome]|uniref:Uncharacterized protein n=1 Tax=bioreactor metagenome TaxID=1076179 RepID=A0A645CZQ5_9ZZZZ